MGFPLAEVMRIGAAITANAGIPLGGLATAGLNAAANELDKEDDPETPKSVREMKRKRRERWIEYGVKLEKDKRDHLKKHGDGAAIRNTLNNRIAGDMRVVIASDILETEDRLAGEQEVNLYAEAASARARQKL